MKFNLKSDLVRFVRSCLWYANQNKRTVLTGITLAETLANAGLCAKAGWNVHDIYNRMMYELQFVDPRDMASRRAIIMNAVVSALPDVLAGVGLTTVTSGTILYNHKVNSAQIATLGAAYTATKATLDATNNKIEEMFGEKKTQEVKQSIAQDNVKQALDANQNKAVLLTGLGTFICVDSDTGRPFRTCAESLQAAKDAISERINNYHWASQNDLYIELGLPTVPRGGEFGFPEEECFRKSTGKCEAPIDIMVTDYNGEPAYYLDYQLFPRPLYL